MIDFLVERGAAVNDQSGHYGGTLRATVSKESNKYVSRLLSNDAKSTLVAHQYAAR